MKDILKSPFIIEFSNIIDNMYRLGWDERNGGNVSYLLNEEEVRLYLNPKKVLRTIKIDFDAKPVANKIFLVTATGKFFRNQISDPELNSGIIQISPDGKTYNILWGFKDGGGPTSELKSHISSHIVRLKKDPLHRVVIHTHATNLIAMTFIHNLDEIELTRSLWKMCTECLVVFPDGISIVPWMIPGNEEIGKATAKKLEDSRLVLWAMHGVFGCGRSIDDAFGLIETAEKAAEIYLKIASLPVKNEIHDEQLNNLAKAFNVTPKAGVLRM